MNSQQIVAKLWNYRNFPHDDGLSYGDYVEQLTYPLFLQLAHERTQWPWKEKPHLSAHSRWRKLKCVTAARSLSLACLIPCHSL